MNEHIKGGQQCCPLHRFVRKILDEGPVAYSAKRVNVPEKISDLLRGHLRSCGHLLSHRERNRITELIRWFDTVAAETLASGKGSVVVQVRWYELLCGGYFLEKAKLPSFKRT